MSRTKRDLWERTDRGQLVSIPETLQEREARLTWEAATAQCPRGEGEDMDAYAARLQERVEELRLKGQWWDR